MKKIIALVLCFAMVIGFTACEKGAVGINLDKESGVVKISESGAYDIYGTLEGMLYVDAKDDVTLRLKGAVINNKTGPAIYFENAENAVLELVTDTNNILSDGENEELDAVVFATGNLGITGRGALEFKAYGHGIYAENITVADGILNITSDTGKGIKGQSSVIINGGDIEITTLADEGIESKGIMEINGGNIKVVAAEDGLNTGSPDSSTTETAVEEVPPAPPQGERPEPPVDFKEGERPQLPPDFKEGERPPMPPEGGMGPEMMTISDEEAKAHSITINGGNIYIDAVGDGIDSNGHLTITGGNIVVDGPVSNDDSPIDSEGTMTISGGNVVVVSSAGMVQLPRGNDSQNIIAVRFGNKYQGGTRVTLKCGDLEIASYIAKKEFGAFVVSSEKIEEGKEYTVYVDDKEYKSITAAKGTNWIR